MYFHKEEKIIIELEKLEIKLMDLDKVELQNFLEFILNEHPYNFVLK